MCSNLLIYGHSNKFEEVNMTSVDRYLEVTGTTSLDILKIDTEGNDNKVLLGSLRYVCMYVCMYVLCL
jgi:FkbM family methyltransferase